MAATHSLPPGKAATASAPLPFVQRVEDDGQAVPGPFNDLLAVHVLAVIEHGAELEQRVGPSRRRRIRHPGREHSVAHPLGDGGSLRAVGSDQHFDVDGPVGHEPIRVQHADRRPLPLDGLAPQQRPQRHDVLLDDRPSQRPLSEGVATGEPRADRRGHPAGRDGGKGGDRRRVGHRVTQARHEHAGTETDRGRPLRGQRQRHPHVGRDRRRVVEPGPLVAKAFRLSDEFGRIDVGDQGARKLHALQTLPADYASSVRTIQPATADGSIASIRSITPP